MGFAIIIATYGFTDTKSKLELKFSYCFRQKFMAHFMQLLNMRHRSTNCIFESYALIVAQ